MSLAKLTTKEIEHKIDQLSDRIDTLTEIINEIKDDSGKKTLQIQLEDYQTTLDGLRNELERRNSTLGRPASSVQ